MQSGDYLIAYLTIEEIAMKQFIIKITHKGNGRTDSVNITASSLARALLVCEQEYPGYAANPVPIEIKPPHYFYNEIDATAE